jgi:uncharacterized protein (TIGR02266 family)
MRKFALNCLRRLFQGGTTTEKTVESWTARAPLASGIHDIDPRAAFVALRVVPDPPEAEEAEASAANTREPPVIAVEFTDDTHFFTSLAGDVADGGIFVATYERLAIGTKLALWFELPAGSVLDARGEVRWIREEGGLGRPGLGIGFTELSPEAHDAIAYHCERHPPLYAEV